MPNKTNQGIVQLPKNGNKKPTNDLKTENEQIIEEKQKKPKTRRIVKVMLDKLVYLCPNCKTIVHEDHNYCYECGWRLK